MKKLFSTLLFVTLVLFAQSCFGQKTYQTQYATTGDSTVAEINRFELGEYKVVANGIDLMVLHYEETTDQSTGTVSYYYQTELDSIIIHSFYMDGNQTIAVSNGRQETWTYYNHITKL